VENPSGKALVAIGLRMRVRGEASKPLFWWDFGHGVSLIPPLIRNARLSGLRRYRHDRRDLVATLRMAGIRVRPAFNTFAIAGIGKSEKKQGHPLPAYCRVVSQAPQNVLCALGNSGASFRAIPSCNAGSGD
jgi:hypothetical protein